VITESAGEDGCAEFTFSLSDSGTTLDTGAVMQYRETGTAEAKTVFTTTKDITATGSSFTITPSDMTVGSFHIPSKGSFKGGDYNAISGNVTFTPNDDGTYSIGGTFHHQTPQADDTDCSWDASSSGSFKEKKEKKAAH
jgi:hypothetical protein